MQHLHGFYAEGGAVVYPNGEVVGEEANLADEGVSQGLVLRKPGSRQLREGKMPLSAMQKLITL